MIDTSYFNKKCRIRKNEGILFLILHNLPVFSKIPRLKIKL
jgi:hypothetical protein